MNTKNERTQSGESRPALAPTRPSRFRINKLEERIAPKGWGKGGKFTTESHPARGCSS